MEESIGLGVRGGSVDYEHKIAKPFGDRLLRMNRYHSNPFDTLLDHFMHFLHIEPLPASQEQCPHMTQLVSDMMLRWSQAVEVKHGQVGYFDMFGAMYEYVASHMGKKHMGQYFTPEHIADMLNHLCNPTIVEKQGPVTIQDPACGSGRMLLSAGTYIANTLPQEGYRYLDNYFLCGNDLDYKCTKMTIINFVLHGFTGEVTCANGLFMESDYRFGYQVRTIPMWKHCYNMYNRAAKEIQDGDDSSEAKLYLAAFGGDKQAAVNELLIHANACKLGKHYPEFIHPTVRDKIGYYQCYSDIDKVTYHSPPTVDSMTIIKKITKEESFQVACERRSYLDAIESKKEKKLNEEGEGLFAGMNINRDVIKVKKATEKKKVVKKKSIKKKPPTKGGEQTLLF
jgi:type I restriction enzyme M protein